MKTLHFPKLSFPWFQVCMILSNFSFEELTHWKRPWCWEGLGAGGGGDGRGWDGWMASLIKWTWVWVNSRSWWWTGDLVCCDSWGLKELDTPEWLNWLTDWSNFWAFPGGINSKEAACQCRRCKRCGFDPWVGKIPWRKAWQLTLIFLPGESHEQRSPAGYSPWGRKESDMTEAIQQVCTSSFCCPPRN